MFFNPIHASFLEPNLWLAEGEIGKKDSTKVGCKKLTTIKQIALPIITYQQKIDFLKEICKKWELVLKEKLINDNFFWLRATTKLETIAFSDSKINNIDFIKNSAKISYSNFICFLEFISNSGYFNLDELTYDFFGEYNG